MSSLLRGFTDSVHHYPTRSALHFDDRVWTYEELAERAGRIAQTIQSVPTESPLVGVLAPQSETAYAAILGVLAAGNGYVPIHPYFPRDRIVDIVKRSEIDTLIVSEEALEHLETILESSERRLTIIAPQVQGLQVWMMPHRTHRLLAAPELLPAPPSLALPQIDDESTAYLLFTSGSTGQPKGVPISHRSVSTYIDHICQSFEMTPDDRVSQTFKLAFDLSVHDMFTAWSNGGCLYPLSRRARMAPGRFIRRHELTIWFSVPTLAMTMDRFRQLAPGAFPSLRASLFCGEALPASLAQKWSEASPNSTVDNFYGPTETTITITSYRWNPQDSPGQCRNGIVPLGRSFPGQSTEILPREGQAPQAREGELLLSGSQVSAGYWRAPQLTRDSFIQLPHTGDQRWYRTGDIVEEDESGCLHFIGRTDHQIQLGGHRVELAEVDFALRQACGHDLAICIAWPYKADEVRGIVGFVATETPIDEANLLESCRRQLPNYMMPDRIISLSELPCNSNGKVDRGALQRMLDNEEGVQ